jgi:hypothetical protein
MRVILPRDQFVTCVDCYEYDEKPHLFVKGGWLTNLHLRAHSVFAIVDAIGIKAALSSGTLTRKRLIRLRNRIDTIGKKYPAISFVSFADSLLLKSNWFVGQYNSRIRYTYEPEAFVRVLGDIRAAYRQVFGMEIYAILSQGSNEYYDDALLHISSSKNHISLNSLGLPFAQLMAIEAAARRAIKEGVHAPAELYMEEDFFHSLSFKYEFAKDKNDHPKNRYQSPMATGETFYFYSDYQTIKDNLRLVKPRSRVEHTKQKKHR